MARINIDILGVSELKWMGMGKFNSDDYHIYYCGQESHRRNGVAFHSQQKSGKSCTGIQSQKWENDFNMNPRQTFQHDSHPSLCTNHWCWRGWNLPILWRITTQLKLKKVGKTTGPLRYNLNQIPYEYTVEVKNRFKELDLVGRVPEGLWMEARSIVHEAQ